MGTFSPSAKTAAEQEVRNQAKLSTACWTGFEAGKKQERKLTR